MRHQVHANETFRSIEEAKIELAGGVVAVGKNEKLEDMGSEYRNA
jgi:hypothetical protein